MKTLITGSKEGVGKRGCLKDNLRERGRGEVGA